MREPMHSFSSWWHFLLMVGVIIAWGLNFVMVKVSLDHIPPLTLCTLRFLLCCLPLVFFVKKPDAPWLWVILYGLVIFAMQFGLLFVGMNAGVSSGIAALLLQFQVFFAIFFACIFAKQRPRPIQLIGACVAFSGISVIFMNLGGGECTLLGFVCLLSAALCWGAGSVIGVKLGSSNMFSLVIWGSMVAFPPLLIASLLIETPQAVFAAFASLHELPLTILCAIAYTIYISTHFAYGSWSWLLTKYTMAAVAPFALLIPIVAMWFSSLMLGETFERWKILAAVLVMLGMAINVLGERIIQWTRTSWQTS